MSQAGGEDPATVLALSMLLKGRRNQSIPDGAQVRVTEIAGYLIDRIKADNDCPEVPDVVIGGILGKMCTVVESKGTRVRVKQLAGAPGVGPVWLPRDCVDHHKDRVRVTSDAAALKAAVDLAPGVQWEPSMEQLAGQDGDVLGRAGGAVAVTFASVKHCILPEAATEIVPDRCCNGLYPGQKVRVADATRQQLPTLNGLKLLFGADGSRHATVQGHATDGDPRFLVAPSSGGGVWVGTAPRLFVAPLLQQGTRVVLSRSGANNPVMRAFLKPGETGLVVGFDDSGDPKVHVSGERVSYVSQDFVVDESLSAGMRPAVGDRVVLAPGGPTFRCLQPGDCGILEQDDGTIQPFKVRFNDKTDWYREDEIIKAPAAAQ